jgi:hypothetical protein
MAGDAADAAFRVQRVDGVHVLRVRCMASQAAVINLFGRVILEDEDLRDVATASDVSSSRTMAAFASLL